MENIYDYVKWSVHLCPLSKVETNYENYNCEKFKIVIWFFKGSKYWAELEFKLQHLNRKLHTNDSFWGLIKQYCLN